MKRILTGLLILTVAFAMAQNSATWCGSVLPESYKQEYAARDRSNYAQLYAQRGGIQWVGVFYHVITKDDGTGGVGLRKVFESHCELNEAYNQFNIGFYISGIDTIKNTTLWNFQNQSLGWQAFSQFNETNVCNVYLNGNLPGLCGFATFPNSAPNGGGVFMNAADCLGTATTTLPHEVGHYFGLMHTFDTSYGVEYVDGSNCNNAGDLFCDTPADFLDQRTPCPYTGTQTDPHGDLYSTVIDESLYMSYFNDNCVYRFSPMEETEMNQVLVNDRPNLLIPPVPDLTPLDTAHFLSPVNGDTTLMGTSVTIKWNAIPRATHYILKVQSGSGSVTYVDSAITDTFFVLNNLVSNKAYKYRVKGICYGNTCSPATVFNTIKTSPIKGNVTVVSPSCQGETDASIVVNPTNGLFPYTVSWSNGSTGNTVSNLAPGTYTVTITDANGAVGISQVVVTDPAPVVVDIQQIGNNLNAYGSGGTQPYTYTWSNGTTGQFNNNVNFGTYTVTVTDSKGCSVVETFVFSSIGVNTDLNVGMKVFPNPVSQNSLLNVQINLNENTDAVISVINVNGEIVQEVRKQLTDGANSVIINSGALAPGVYLVRFNSTKATKTVRISILK